MEWAKYDVNLPASLSSSWWSAEVLDCVGRDPSRAASSIALIGNVLGRGCTGISIHGTENKVLLLYVVFLSRPSL